MSKALSTAIALLAILAVPTAIATAGKGGKKQTVTQKGKVGISAKVEPGESFVPKSGGAPIKLKFERKGKRLTKLKAVDFEEITFLCKGGPGIIAQGVRVGGAKVSKAKKNHPPAFRFFEKGGSQEAFLTLGASGARSYKFSFDGKILDGTKRATGKLKVEFVDREQGACTTGTQVYRSESK